MRKNFKLQVQEDEAHPEQWHDVRNEAGELLIFDNETAARAELLARYPILVKLEQFAAGRKRSRVVIINPYQDIDQELEEE